LNDLLGIFPLNRRHALTAGFIRRSDHASTLAYVRPIAHISLRFEEEMLKKQWFALGACAALPFAVLAEQKHPAYNPTDVHAPVIVVPYESAFKGFRTASDDEPSPDKAWRSANDEMGKLGGHAGHMKAEQAQPATSSAVKSAPARPDSAVDHSKHH
jgi:hypothetical protein